MLSKGVIVVLVILGLFLIGATIVFYPLIMLLISYPLENTNNCIELRSSIYQEMENVNYCSTINDCAERWAEAQGTIFNCEIYLLNKNANISYLKTLFSEYENSCSSEWRMSSCGVRVPIQFTFIDCQDHKCVLNWTTDESICELFDDKRIRDNCYGKIAIMTTNSTLCDKIEDQIIKEQCTVSIETKLSHNLSSCNNKDDKDGCYKFMAVELNDLSICDEIIKSSTKYLCYYQIAHQNHDPSICKKIPLLKEYEKMRKNCESRIS